MTEEAKKRLRKMLKCHIVMPDKDDQEETDIMAGEDGTAAEG